MTSPVFTFDPNSHVYYLDGQEIPGVSDVLEEAGLKHLWGGFAEAQFRGLTVHSVCECYDLDEAYFGKAGALEVMEEWGRRYPQYVGYTRGWVKCREETGFVPEYIEPTLYHPAFRFGGTPDRAGTTRHDYEETVELVIVDIKTGVAEDWHKEQLAGYQILLAVLDPKWLQARRCNVYVQENGNYQLVWRDDPADLQHFLAALTVCHLKRGRK